MDLRLKPRCLVLVAGIALVAGGSVPGLAEVHASAQAKLAQAYGRLPLRFEPNEGQVDRAVSFLCRSRGFSLFLTPAVAVLDLGGWRGEDTVVRMRLAGGNEHPRLEGEMRLPTLTSYFVGDDPRRWQIAIPSYAQVRYENVYPGVDLIYRGNQRQLEYDFVIAPGADPRGIRLAFGGAGSITIGPQGELVLHTPSGELVQHTPEVYQEARGRRQRIEGHYVLLAAASGKDATGGERGSPEVGFVVGTYDRSRPLIIDPAVAYSTFLGGTGTDIGRSIAVDAVGNAYVTGDTTSPTFPGVSGSAIQPTHGSGSLAAFVTKINVTGTAIVYSTFLGGSGSQRAFGIAVDGEGSAYITGGTTSTTFPGISLSSIQPANGGGADAFVTKIDSTGTAIVYSTFLGGSGDDGGNGIAVDGAGSAYITGGTTSSSFPGVAGSSIQPTNGGGGDAFVTKINPTGTAIVYSTFLGGSDSDTGVSIAVDGARNAYVTGQTVSSTFPGVNSGSIQPANGGGGDAFVTKINAAGTAIAYSTFLGGNDFDLGFGIAVDAAGGAYVTGQTLSSAFPGVSASSIQPANGGGFDAFVTKIDPTGTAIVYSTFLGGSSYDFGNGIAVDSAGNAYVVGSTGSATFPGVNGDSIQPVNTDGADVFLIEIDPLGTGIVYSTFIGNSGENDAGGIAVDGAGNAYITGLTTSSSFTGVSGKSIQPAYGGGETDAFVAKIAPGFNPAIPALDRRGLGILALLLAILGWRAAKRVCVR